MCDIYMMSGVFSILLIKVGATKKKLFFWPMALVYFEIMIHFIRQLMRRKPHGTSLLSGVEPATR